jgi:CheY-like chemotaxis protein
VPDATLCMIDDDAHDAFLARRLFARSAPALRVIHRADAAAICDDVESLRAGEPAWPDFIFLDINMPKANGLALLRRLKSHDAARRIPVFMFTTSDQQENVETAYANGASAYFVKPHSVEDYLKLTRAFAAFWLETARRPRVS